MLSIILQKNKCGGACPLLSLKALNRYLLHDFMYRFSNICFKLSTKIVNNYASSRTQLHCNVTIQGVLGGYYWHQAWGLSPVAEAIIYTKSRCSANGMQPSVIKIWLPVMYAGSWLTAEKLRPSTVEGLMSLEGV